MDASELGGFVEQHSVAFGVVAVTSLVFVVGGAALGPVFIARLPTDYFASDVMSRRLARKSSLAMSVARNLAGIALLMVGLLLLILPGQGLLTILAGLLLVDFPAKKSYLARVLKRPKVRAALDWVRRRVGKEPFDWE